MSARLLRSRCWSLGVMAVSLALAAIVGVSCGGAEKAMSGDISLSEVESVFSSHGINLIEIVSPAEPGSCLDAVLAPKETADDSLDVSVLCNQSAARTLFRQATGGSEENQAEIDGAHVFRIRNIYVVYRPSGEISLEDVETVIDDLAQT